jgi:hypothetical protein
MLDVCDMHTDNVQTAKRECDGVLSVDSKCNNHADNTQCIYSYLIRAIILTLHIIGYGRKHDVTIVFSMVK